jgi:hypothetical protein
MDDWLIQSLANLYEGNIMLCTEQWVNRVECEKRIETTLKAIQWRVDKVCKWDKACELQGLEWEIDNVEMDKLRQKLLWTYT